jgi:ParB/RepB/Spo0J family partition protein
LVPQYFDTERIVTPEGNPDYTPAMLADLLEGIRQHGQLVPAWLCPSPDLPEGKLICLEGNRRLAVCRLLGRELWAFDSGHFVPEKERIELTFQHNLSRRVMSRDEIAERAARWMEITGSTQAEAARQLNVSPPTLSRAFGDRRFPPELKQRADRLGLAIRSLIAALPPPLMAQAIEFAEKPGPDGKKPTRDQVIANNHYLKKSGKPNRRKTKSVTLRVGNRSVTLTLREKDNTVTVSEDFKTIVTRLAEHPDVQPEGWPFLFP